MRMCADWIIVFFLHGIPIYWPGMDNTAFLVIFMDIHEHFDNIVKSFHF